jgi:PBP1b-binding outer membrane lipoprotein LpoB
MKRIGMVVLVAILMGGCTSSPKMRKDAMSGRAIPVWASEIKQSSVLPQPCIVHAGNIVTNRVPIPAK